MPSAKKELLSHQCICYQWIEFHEVYSYDISDNGIVMHIKVCHNGCRYTGVFCCSNSDT